MSGQKTFTEEQLHAVQWLTGWEYCTTIDGTGRLDEWPAWELNVDAGDAGRGTIEGANGAEITVTYWRRRKP